MGAAGEFAITSASPATSIRMTPPAVSLLRKSRKADAGSRRILESIIFSCHGVFKVREQHRIVQEQTPIKRQGCDHFFATKHARPGPRSRRSSLLSSERWHTVSINPDCFNALITPSGVWQRVRNSTSVRSQLSLRLKV